MTWTIVGVCVAAVVIIGLLVAGAGAGDGVAMGTGKPVRRD